MATLNEADVSTPDSSSAPRRQYQVGLFLILVAIVVVGLFLAPLNRSLSWALTLALMATFILVAGKQVKDVWRGALIDERNRISLSRLQLILWTALVLSAYLCAALYNVAERVRDPLSIAIPAQLWIVLGISATSLVGSPLIKGTKKKKDPDGTQKGTTIKEISKGGQRRTKNDGLILENEDMADACWADVFSGEETGNGATLDLSKIQMFFFTAVILIAYGFAVGDAFGEPGGAVRSLPSVHESMTVLLGISHTGYLTHKALPLSKEATS